MSGFFGVTSLGPSDPIAANLLSTLGITSFSDEEFEVAFKSLMDDQENINKIDVYECLTRTYGFEPMPEEINLFVQNMALSDDGTLSWTEFHKGLGVIRDKIKKMSRKATHYDSYQDLVDDRRKHSRVAFGPQEIYKRPMTTAQAVGWHDEEVYNERFPKQQCAETVYADCLVKSGWIP